MGRIVIVSNRLPVTIERRKGSLNYRQSAGGVATGLSSFYKAHESIWIGWPGIANEKLSSEEKETIKDTLETEFSCYPVFLSQKSIRQYYEGFSNKTIWPLFHYFSQFVIHDKHFWRAYCQVNEQFSHVVSEIVRQDDMIWIHDYQLMLVPQFLRKNNPEIAIGYFHHIPFPSYELFRLLPWRRQILEGLVGADLIGFHTDDYARHFLVSIHRLLGHEHNLGQFTVDNRLIRVDTFPMGIDYDRFSQAFSNAKVKKDFQRFKQRVSDCKVILSVDRLDYTKGIPQRLEAFGDFLDKYQEYREKIVLVLVAVPSRTKVEHYERLKRTLDELVGMINGKYGTIGWTPIWYFYRTFSFNALTVLYNIADVCLVTPVRDGMNLIAKEYIASKNDGAGVLILSEMTGAAKEMGESIIVNPNNREEVVDAIVTALNMSEEERIQRNRVMQSRLERYNVKRWAREFIERLGGVKKRQQEMSSNEIKEDTRKTLMKDCKSAKRRLFLLDYDGTLVPFYQTPEEAKPGKELIELISNLAAVSGNQIVIISGRDKQTLEAWFGNLPIGIVAEHGAWIKEDTWEILEPLSNDWKKEIYPTLELYMDRTPGSFIEEKDYSLVWHYRKTSSELSAMRVRELTDELVLGTANLNLQILHGDKVVEVKNSGINKGRTALYWLEKDTWDFVIAIGDDRTDEDMFLVLPERCYSVKVGLSSTAARYNVKSQNEVILLLKEFLSGVVNYD